MSIDAFGVDEPCVQAYERYWIKVGMSDQDVGLEAVNEIT